MEIFFEPYFDTASDAHQFVNQCELLDGPHVAKLMMHQTCRLVSLAREVSELPSGRDSLRVLFRIICTEAIAKLHAGFDGEGQSKKHVRLFFETFLTGPEQDHLIGRVQGLNAENLGLRDIVDRLYAVRCDVVHEGQYWGFSFSRDGSMTVTGRAPFATSLGWRDLENLVVLGAIRATEQSV